MQTSIGLNRWMFVLVLGICACSKQEAPPEQQVKSAAPAVSAAPVTARAPLPPLPDAPKSLGPMRIPPSNPQSAEKARLGQRLFFDRRLSGDGSLACYDCHLNEDGTGGHDPTAIGIQGKKLTRHSPIMWNVAYLPRLYWDGRADSLEAVAKGALGGPNMGVGEENLLKKADEIGALPEYKQAFDDIFPADGATPVTIAQALASYERTLFCGDTAWDRFTAGEDAALNSEQKQGWELFKGKAACNACHVPPFFSDAYLSAEGAFHNNGIGLEGKKESDVDVGRMKVTNNPADWATFKTPSLRNVTKSPPYFHNGAMAKLEDAVRFMAKGGFKNKNLDARLVDKQLSDQEIKAIVAFLGSLECSGKLEPAP